MKVQAVIFDFDQVLIRAYSQHTKAFLAAGRKFGYKLNRREIQKRFGISAKELVRQLIPKIAEDELEKFVDYKERIYRKLVKKEGVSLMPYAEQLLKFLQKNKIKVAVASSASEKNIRLAYRKTQLKNFFLPFVAAEHVKRHKPHPEPLLKAAKILGVDPQACIYVGDSIYEMIAAKRAGMFAIGLHTGIYAERELKKHGAQKVFHNLLQLKKFISKLLNFEQFAQSEE
jgi:HAD superfamily hydrolase (TIGR01509 family)